MNMEKCLAPTPPNGACHIEQSETAERHYDGLERNRGSDCEVPRFAPDDTERTTTAPDRQGTGTKDRTFRARNILRRPLPSV
jgi:hypothetical protein